MNFSKIRKEFGYDGKSKQWQQGFDSLAGHIEDLLKEDIKMSIKEFGYLITLLFVIRSMMITIKQQLKGL
jgi:hypothetical protein